MTDLFHRLILSLISTLLLSMTSVLTAHAEEIKLDIPIIQESPRQHLFFHELLKTALIESGHTPIFTSQELPQTRVQHYMDLGGTSIYWMVESDKRNKRYIPIKIDLTNKMIGKRILFIKKEEQHLYDKVKNLDDFRQLNLVGGMGKNWFDVKIWKENNLKYNEQSGSWRAIFDRLPIARDIDYFSRGINEIITEAIEHSELAIEQNLVLIYDRDFIFYLSKKGPKSIEMYKEKIESALKKAQKSGLIDRLVEKYWGYDFRVLGYDERVKINLKTPK